HALQRTTFARRDSVLEDVHHGEEDRLVVQGDAWEYRLARRDQEVQSFTAHLVDDQIGTRLVEVASVDVRMVESRDETRLTLVLLGPEQLGVGDHPVVADLISHEVGYARGRVGLDMDVDALIVQVLIEVECQALLALPSIALDRPAKPISMEPLAAVLITT